MKTKIDPNKEYNFIGTSSPPKRDENGEIIYDLTPYIVLGKDLTEEHLKSIQNAEQDAEERQAYLDKKYGKIDNSGNQTPEDNISIETE